MTEQKPDFDPEWFNRAAEHIRAASEPNVSMPTMSQLVGGYLASLNERNETNRVFLDAAISVGNTDSASRAMSDLQHGQDIAMVLAVLRYLLSENR